MSTLVNDEDAISTRAPRANLSALPTANSDYLGGQSVHSNHHGCMLC